ncbi:hypothetical protein GGP85_003026 [Salinibacter ruber]|nr:hypothetical protein [Salinibacter ruber]
MLMEITSVGACCERDICEGEGDKLEAPDLR